MWRLCDLHTHTFPNEQCTEAWDAAAFVAGRIALGLDVIAVTDHDNIDRVEEVLQAAEGTSLLVVPGVEVSTDRGHLIVLAPGNDGATLLRAFMIRLAAEPGRQLGFHGVLDAGKAAAPDGRPYAERLVFIAAHVDQASSLLCSGQTASLATQLDDARRVHALEVHSEAVRAEWSASGVKQGPLLTLLRSSDTHNRDDERLLATWLYLPEVTATAFQHALALPEASVDLRNDAPGTPEYWIKSVSFQGGHHDGLTFDFCERTNAIIGPPNAGKSLVVDALKFVFGDASSVPEIEETSRRRMARCLPPGSTVTVALQTPAGVVTLTREPGSARPPEVPFRPIVFSQTELTRRAIASEPDISLIDLHVPESGDDKLLLLAIATRVSTQFLAMLQRAESARQLREVLGNSVDGLQATRAALAELSGTEGVAQLASALASVDAWRRLAADRIDAWRGTSMLDPLELPTIPEAAPEFQRFVPIVDLQSLMDKAHEAARSAAQAAGDQMLAKLAVTAAAFAEAMAEADEALAQEGFGKGSEVQARLSQLRDRLTQLEEDARSLAEHDQWLDEQLVRLRAEHEALESARNALTSHRKSACTRINASMHTFFARIDPAGIRIRSDELVTALCVGTHMRVPDVQEVQTGLDRWELLETAVRLRQGHTAAMNLAQADKMLREALSRGSIAQFAELACLWPGDALILARKGTPPTPFPDLTEGLRALAIKEISFAESTLPVITDQPEDAVPTRSVFESLVPTLRTQRRERQFIIVSHDANIVVASDVERIVVLQANEDQTPHAGGLFDPRIRESALEHLEGGRRAFQLRADRYAASPLV